MAMAKQDTGLVHKGTADRNAELVRLWIHGRPQTTQDTYLPVVRAFDAHIAYKPYADVTLGDIQDFVDTLAHLAPATRAKKVAIVKSLFAFVHSLGLLRANPAAAVRTPKVLEDQDKESAPMRIASERDILQILTQEKDTRTSALLHVLYYAGLRISEAASLRWASCVARAEGGQITVKGKGGKPRTVCLPACAWAKIEALRQASEGEYVFASREGGAITRQQAHNLVKRAVAGAGLPHVSAHWFRHALASHALTRGAPIHVVQATLGHTSLATTSRYVHAPDNNAGAYLAQ